MFEITISCLTSQLNAENFDSHAYEQVIISANVDLSILFPT